MDLMNKKVSNNNLPDTFAYNNKHYSAFDFLVVFFAFGSAFSSFFSSTTSSFASSFFSSVSYTFSSSNFFVPKVNFLPATKASISSCVCAT